MKRILRNKKKTVSCNNSPIPLRRCLQDTSSSQSLKNVFAVTDESNSADNNKLNVANICAYEECHQFTNTGMKCKGDPPESKEKKNIKIKRVLLESNRSNNMLDKSINLNSRKTSQKAINVSNDVLIDGLENCENEFPSSRKNRKNSKPTILKEKTQKTNVLQNCEKEKNSNNEVLKQSVNKQKSVYNGSKRNSANGKETYIIQNNIEEALKALETIPVRKNARLQKKLNDTGNKTNNKKLAVSDNCLNGYKKYEYSEDIQSVLSENKDNQRKCEPVFEKRMKENRRKVLCNIMSPIKENIAESCSGLTRILRDHQVHLPVYKKETDTKNIKCNVPEDSLAVYDFECDENEEPRVKKKRRKRTYTKKPKLCSQNLTINKIKFGSTSSLNSTKSKFGSTDSINSVHSVYNCVNNEKKAPVQNIHKPTVPVYESRNFNSVCTPKKSQTYESILTARQDFSFKDVNDAKKLSNICSPTHEYALVDMKSSQKRAVGTPTHNVCKTIDCTDLGKNESHNMIFAGTPDKLHCSKFQFTDCCAENNLSYNSVHHHDTSCVSAEGMNFSTPCKNRCEIAYSNSVFDEHSSFNSLVRGDKGCNEQNFGSEQYDINTYFGFDSEESINEPLLSSIKKYVPYAKKNVLHVASCKREIFPANTMSIQDITQLLQSEVNHKKKKNFEGKMAENSDSTETDNISLSILKDDDKPVYFRKPPRRSYERIKHYWEQDDVEEGERTVEKEVEEVLEAEVKKHHRKKTKTNAEVEAEKLAAKLNCQFQEIDKFNLCVE